MLFLGTPFRGTPELNQDEMMLAIRSQYADEIILESNLNILTTGNDNLIDLLDTFLRIRHRIPAASIACFYEQKPSNIAAIYKGARIKVSSLYLLQFLLTKSRDFS